MRRISMSVLLPSDTLTFESTVCIDICKCVCMHTCAHMWQSEDGFHCGSPDIVHLCLKQRNKNLFLFLNYVCMCMSCVHVWIQEPGESRRGYLILWSWHSRRLVVKYPAGVLRTGLGSPSRSLHGLSYWAICLDPLFLFVFSGRASLCSPGLQLAL